MARWGVELLCGNGVVVIRVTDTGPGISEQEREAVLRRFYRSDKMRNTPGVGLGLAIARWIATQELSGDCGHGR